MTTCLPFRSRARNVARTTAAPAALHLIASRCSGPDRCQPVLRADLDVPAAGAKRHALQVLASLVAREPGAAFDVQLLAGNVPVFVASSEGAAL